MTIGALGPWNVPAARNRALELRRAVDSGLDPLADKAESRARMNVRDVWRWYVAGGYQWLSAASQRNVEAAWHSKIEPHLGPQTKLAEITRSDVQALVDKITQSVGPTAANRCHSYLRRIFNLAKAEGFIDSNPAAAQIQRNQEHARERYLSEAEFKRLVNALDNRPTSLSALAIRLLLFTGARKSEVLSMRWEDVDLEGRGWTKAPTMTKQKRRHYVPLSGEAMKIVQSIEHMNLDGPYIFAGKGSTGHLRELKKVWNSLRVEADIGECRIHDLRHTYASIIASKGGSLEIIGALLGHSQVQTTKRYAHLFDKTLREATELIGT